MLAPYAEPALCPKCRSAKTNVKWCEGEGPALPCWPEVKGQHLHVVCEKCLFTWMMHCADHLAEEPCE